MTARGRLNKPTPGRSLCGGRSDAGLRAESAVVAVAGQVVVEAGGEAHRRLVDTGYQGSGSLPSKMAKSRWPP